MSLEAFPPLFLISFRFLLSGAIMLIAARMMNASFPKGRELWMTAFYGIITLGGGNGCLVWAEQTVPSGIAALMITTSPFWMVGLEAALPRGTPIHLPTLGGIFVGFLGVVLLVAPTGSQGFNTALLPGFLILQVGCFLWCLGALLQRRLKTTSHPAVAGAIQQLATGLFFAIPAAIDGSVPTTWASRSTWAVLYLVTFGSIVGYTAFVYAMEHLPVPIVTTYNYVNPVVAMFLGWAFYREPFGMRETLAMLVIFAGVALVKWSTSSAPKPKPALSRSAEAD
jgi:drug/metabolite transporter (DMT)-like permease